MAHGENCFCDRCAAKRYGEAAERANFGETWEERHERIWGRSPQDEPPRPSGASGLCGDCGGTGDCIHCNQGSYTRRDGTKAICGKCHGQTRRGRYRCHACKGKGYGGQRCGTPTYMETEARNQQMYTKYKSSTDRDTGMAQTDFYMGYIGERNQKKKVHIAINEQGDVVFVRDLDGRVLYDRKNGTGRLPDNLNWS